MLEWKYLKMMKSSYTEINLPGFIWKVDHFCNWMYELFIVCIPHIHSVSFDLHKDFSLTSIYFSFHCIVHPYLRT